MSNVSALASMRILEPVPGAERGPAELPTPLTSFIGREEDVARALALLSDASTRLLTLIGPGGVGKTRLAIELARHARDAFADGVIFVPLAALREPALVPVTLARRLGVEPRGERHLVDELAHELRDRHLLVVLDNYEHLLGEPPAWLSEILGRCPRLTVLVTSRSALNIGGERRYPVAPLPLPGGDAARDETESAAVALFVDRARAVRPELALDDAALSAISAICRQLDGLPLAIELAAARVTVLSPEQLLARLTDRFRLLAGGQRDAPPRLRSMRDAIAWSYDLLAPDERRLFRWLSVFVGGFTLEAAEAMGEGIVDDTIAVLASLVDNSLLRLADEPGGHARYSMFETIRDFGLEQAEANGEAEAARERHAGWCLDLVRPANPVDPSSQELWYLLLERDYPNLGAAMRWLDATDRIRELAELVTQLRWFWHLTERDEEGMHWYERILARYPDRADLLYADTLRWAGHMAQLLGRPESSRYLQRAMDAARAAGDTQREAAVTELRAIEALSAGDYDQAEQRFHRAMSLFDATYYPWKRRVTEFHLGVVAFGRGERDAAARHLEQAREAALAADDKLVPAWCSIYLALIACERGDIQGAAAHLRPHVRETQGVSQIEVPRTLRVCGVLASAAGLDEVAARLFGAAARGENTAVMPERPHFERAEAASRARMGDESWNRVSEEGRAWPNAMVVEAVDRLLHRVSRRAAPDATPASAAGLTPREQEVLGLLAEGLANQQIADALFISQKTVAHHVTSILGKLGVDSRSAAVSHAIRHRLV